MMTYVPLGTANSPSWVDSTAVTGALYVYRYRNVHPTNVWGGVSGDSPLVTRGWAPDAPIDLRATPQDPTSVLLSWIPSPNAARFEVWRSSVSGGPYTLAASTADGSTTTASESGLTPGQIYYYVVRAVSASSVASADSNEAAVVLNPTPPNLTASSSNHQVALSWSAIAGATAYRVQRRISGQGFQTLTSLVVGTEYIDTDIIDGNTYDYRVAEVGAGGESGVYSDPATVTAVSTHDFQHVIDLVDRGLLSSLSESQFYRASTTLSSSDYDGITSFELEIIADNSDSVSRAVRLVTSANTVIHTEQIPAGSSSARLRAPLSLSGNDTYRLSLEGTTSAGQLIVHSARVFITQSGATRTRLYFPLTSATETASNADESAGAATTTTSSGTLLNGVTSYFHDPASLTPLSEVDGISFEALVSTTPGAQGEVSLMRADTGTVVGGTATQFSGGSGILTASASVLPGATNFIWSGSTSRYAPRLICTSGCSGGEVRLLRAGVWVRLEKIQRGLSYFRIAGNTSGGGADFDTLQSRQWIDAAAFSNPTLSWMMEYSQVSASSGSFELWHTPTAASAVPNGAISIVSAQPVSRTFASSISTLEFGDSREYYLRGSAMSGGHPSLSIHQAGIYIRFGRP